MKKLLLSAALAAPLLLSAQATPPDDSVISYDMPAGTFFATSMTDNVPQALLPPASTLTWPNTSFYFDFSSQSILGLQTFYQWTYDLVNPYDGTVTPMSTNDSTLVTDPAFTALTPFIAPISLPTLSEVDTQNSFSPDLRAYVGADLLTLESYTTYDPRPAGLTLEMKDVEEFAIGSSNLSMLWTSEYSDLGSEVSVDGFAQLIEYGGCPYVLDRVNIVNTGKFSEGEGFTFSIYQYPGEGNPLPAEPIYSQVYSAPGNNVSSVDIDLTFDGLLTVTEPIVLAITDISAISFSPRCVVATQKPYYPEPVNRGLYAIASYTQDGTPVSNALLPWKSTIGTTEAVSLPIALDLQIHPIYCFFEPSYIVSEDRPVTSEKDFEINFTPALNEIDYRCIASTISPSEFTITQPDGSELPDWIVAEVTNYDRLGDEMKALAKDFGITDDADIHPRIVNLAIYTVRSINADVDIKVSVPGGSYAIFTIHSRTSGIDAVASDAEIVARQFFDISGRQLKAEPESGFFIERTIRADGTTTSSTRTR